MTTTTPPAMVQPELNKRRSKTAERAEAAKTKLSSPWASLAAVIIAGLFTFFMAPFFGRLIRFFPPVVTGSVISIIGISLLPVAANDAVRDGIPVMLIDEATAVDDAEAARLAAKAESDGLQPTFSN